jgi:hypothetical protein
MNDGEIFMAGLVHYPFQLRDGLWVYLRLPSDLTVEDVRRIVATLSTLAVEAKS